MKQHQTTTYFLLLMAFLFAFSSCSWFKKTSSSSEVKLKKGYTRHTNDTHGISVKFPSSWEVKINPSTKGENVKGYFKVAFNAVSPLEDKKDKYQENIGIVLVDLNALREYKLKKIKEGNTGEQAPSEATKISSSGMVRVNDLLASWVISKNYASDDGKLQLKQMAYTIEQGTTLYKIGWVGEAEKLPAYRAVIDKVVASLQFE